MRLPGRWFVLAVCCGLLLCASEPLRAAPPNVTHLFPAGGQMGTTVSVTATGSFSTWPVDVWVDRPGLAVQAGEKKGQLEVAIADDASPGVFWLRLFDAEGTSEPRPFLVDTATELLETEPNNEAAQAQVVEALPTIVNGKLARSGDVDSYRVTLSAGQTLVAAVEANWTLAAPMDAVLQIASADGFVLAQNDDDRGLDPTLVFSAPHDGDYLVRLFAFPEVATSTIGLAGAETFIYRLTLSTGRYCDFSAPQLAELVESAIALNADLPQGDLTATGLRHWSPMEQVGWLALPGAVGTIPVRLPVGPVVMSTGDGPALAVPGVACGTILVAGQRDAYRFEATKGQKVLFRIQAREAGSSLDPVLRLLDAAGKVLNTVDDTGSSRDAELLFNPPADGEYQIEVSDLHRHAGPRYAYWLEAVRPDRQFRLSTTASRYTVAAGESVEIPVSIVRGDGAAAEIEISVDGLPEGIDLAPQTSAAKGDTSKEVKLKLTASGEAWSGPITIRGRAGQGDDALVRWAAAPLLGRAGRGHVLWLTVTAGKSPK